MQSAAARPAEPTPLAARGADQTAVTPPPVYGCNVRVGACLLRAVWTLVQLAAARPAEPTPLTARGVDPTAATPPPP